MSERTETVAEDARAGGTPLCNIVGQRIALGPLRRELVPTYTRWINDFGTTRTLAGIPLVQTLEQEQGWYDSQISARDAVTFTIYERSSWQPIGTAGLQGIDYRNGTAEFGILIGEAACRGRGYGAEATSLVLDFAFTGLGLSNVMLKVYAFNEAGQRAYTRAGFREFGRRRESLFMGGRFWDVVYMECVAAEFASPLLAQILAPDQPRGAIEKKHEDDNGPCG